MAEVKTRMVFVARRADCDCIASSLTDSGPLDISGVFVAAWVRSGWRVEYLSRPTVDALPRKCSKHADDAA